MASRHSSWFGRTSRFLIRVVIKNSTLSTKEKYDFAMMDVTGNGRPDLVAIQKTGVDNDKARVVVLVG